MRKQGITLKRHGGQSHRPMMRYGAAERGMAVGSEKTEAIVLRLIPWSETSYVVHLYTREHGKRHAIAKGARRRGSPFAGALDLLASCAVVFIPKSGDALDIFTEAKLIRRFRISTGDLLRLNCGYYVLELLDRLTEIGQAQPELFDLAAATIEALDCQQADCRSVVLRFELGLLRETGLLPNLERCVECGRAWKQLNKAGKQQEWYLFSASGSGFYCEDCWQHARRPIRIAAHVFQILVQYAREDWREVPIETFPDAHARVIRRIMQETMRYHLDAPPRTEPYVQPLAQ